MNQLKTILVGVDFSECSRTALRQAARVASINRARLHLLHVIEDLVLSELAETLKVSDPELRELTVDRAEVRLKEWLGEFVSDSSARVEARIGNPLDVILRKARDVGADLIVLGETGLSTPGGGAGVLATKILRKSPCKVMLVHEKHLEPFRRVLACLDFSETAAQVAVQARRVATQDNSELHFLHVIDPPWRRLHYLRPAPEGEPDFKKQYLDTLSYRLEQFVEGSGAPAGRCSLHEASSAGSGIAEYARRIQADLVVLGTKGRTNLKYVLLGSTAERLLRDVPCSILAIKPPGFAGIDAN